MVAERSRLTATLRSAGYQVPDSEANFVWLADGPAEHGCVDAVAFGEGCEAGGVIVRVFAGFRSSDHGGHRRRERPVPGRRYRTA